MIMEKKKTKRFIKLNLIFLANFTKFIAKKIYNKLIDINTIRSKGILVNLFN